ncbi:CHASE domain-containing protein [Pseudomonas benzenivorans]|uniref:histidine kinase n=1 Tax=Pseudomonas benzenivorans TaxID=556533 RepID=A0ABY5H4F0_9PSED|nr:CHASE domain-containing protein [Pseudomonas benzenivorans]UTW07182.1 CHASE domain-containing protein [Pseudomonas benzenivorans]
MQYPIPLPLKILLLALAYAVAGRLALMLAIPPGFASAVFPPVGIALAAVLIWGYPMLAGVFLGSTLLNLSIGFSSLEQLSLEDLLVASGIAFGTSLQALVASWLIRSFVGFPTPLTSERSIFLLLLLGGPMACLISASMGTGVLYLNQLIGAEELPFSWWTWWVGDSVGVLIATPLMFILFAEPRALWRSRAGGVGLPLLISCAIMVLIFVRASDAEQNNLRLRFHEQAKLMSATLKFRFELYGKAAQSIERLFNSSEGVSRQDFARFVANLPSTYPGITALSWDALVTAGQREGFETQMAAEGFAGFRISEFDAAGQLVSAGARPAYVPVTYVEPLGANVKALGFDVASLPLRRQALERARDSARTVMTAPITLVQDKQTPQLGVLLLHPVYAGELAPLGVSERRRQLRGYAAAVVRMADLIENALKAYPADSYRLQLEDVSDAAAQPLYGQPGIALPAYATELVWQEQLEIGGRQLRLTISPTEAFLRRNHGLQPWAVLAGGLLLCSLLGGYLLTITGRADQIRHQVRQRTLELSAILENAAEGILIFDEQGLIGRANPASSRLFGYPTSELVGRRIGSLIPSLHPCSAERLDGQLGNALEVSGTHTNGKQLELEISLSSYALPGRRLYICMLRDISARKQVERMKSEFVATVSHELRTPLTSIKGSLGLLTAGAVGPLSEQAHQLVSIAQSNSERLVSLVNDILDIEKLEFGHTRLQLSRTDLRPLLHEALAHNQGYADGFQVSLSLDDSALPAQVPVQVDGLRLQQVLSNLIANAVKFSDPLGRVEISAQLVDQQVRVQVRDYGPGIAEEFRERIFQKFAQADASDSRRRGGTGLGLSICKTLIERMHGQIDYSSVVGQGSTFYFTLPLADT